MALHAKDEQAAGMTVPRGRCRCGPCQRMCLRGERAAGEDGKGSAGGAR